MLATRGRRPLRSRPTGAGPPSADTLLGSDPSQTALAMETVTTSTALTEGSASLWEDFVDIYYAPRQVFARREEGGRWGIVLLILVGLMALLYFAGTAVL